MFGESAEILHNLFGLELSWEKVQFWGLLALKIGIVLVCAQLLVWAGRWLIGKLLVRFGGKRFEPGAEDVSIWGPVVKSLWTYGVYFLAVIFILGILKLAFVDPEILHNIIKALIQAGAILAVSLVVLKYGGTFLDYTFKERITEGKWLDKRRADTLKALAKSVLKYVVYFVSGFMILDTFGVPTTSILAGAGIVGLAIGFGAQNLVRDVISGFFILFEDQFTVGEYISTAGVTGVVEELGIRTTKIREWTGQLHIIPNGSIDKVANYNRGHMLALVVVSISYETDIDFALEVLRQESERAFKEIEAITEIPVVQGVVALGAYSVDIRVIAQTVPGEQWQVERELRRYFKIALENNGIEIPYPHEVQIQKMPPKKEADEEHKLPESEY